MNHLSGLCRFGLHSWPRVHGDWREPVVEPAEADCTRCGRPIKSIWRTVYPKDGSRCRPGSCRIHAGKPAPLAVTSARKPLVGQDRPRSAVAEARKTGM
jgi:hypothetical protein